MATPQRIVVNIRDVSGEREAAQARRALARWLVGLAALMVLLGGTFPFDFSFSTIGGMSAISQRFDLTLNDLWIGESWRKLIFYVPLGFTLGALLWNWSEKRPRERALRGGIAVLVAAAVATMSELLQVFLSRDPSLADVISKTIGGALGLALFIAIGEPAMRVLVRWFLALRRIRDWRPFATGTAMWLVIAVAVPVASRNIGSLKTWDRNYPILIGNETDGVRHWDGLVSNVWLSAGGMDDDQLENVLAAKDPASLLQPSLVMAFHPAGDGPYRDSTGQTGDLVWTGNFTPALPAAAKVGTTEPSDLTGVAAIGRMGVPISEGWWLRTAGAAGATKAIDRIAKTAAFTLVMDFANRDLDHGFDWPHIFSISENARECDLQLLQDHQNLQLRIRSGATGDGGTDPEFVVPNIFMDTLPQRLVVSYDDGQLRVGSDRSGEFFSLRYSPEAWVIEQMFPSSFWHYTIGTSGQLAISALYRVLTMLPIGMLLGAVLRILRQRGRLRHLGTIFICSTCVAVVALELLLHLAAGVSIVWILPGIDLSAACAGVYAVLGEMPIRRRGV